jgi:hypothetical protein
MHADTPVIPQPRGTRTPAEPCTQRALWPTFLRRTLAEDEVVPSVRPRPTAPTASAIPPRASPSDGQ